MTRAEAAALSAYDTNTPAAIRIAYRDGYEQAEKDLINRIRKQVETWMPERDGDEHTEGERLAFRSVLHLLEELEDEK